MKRLGSIKNVMRDGSILLKTNESVKLGTLVYDARGKTLGKVTRVFGPVNGPYMAMKVSDKIASDPKLLESLVYFDPTGKGSAGKKRG